jgi:hypothetical protein
MTRLFLFLALATSLHADGLEAYKRDFLLKQLPQIMKGGMGEEERKLRVATLELNARRFYEELSDERKFYWSWMDTYGLAAESWEKEKLRRYIDSHFSLGKRTCLQSYEDFR